MKKFKKAVISLSLAIVALGSSASSISAYATYTDTDLISIWRVTQAGYIYSPVSVTNQVNIWSEGVGSNYVTSKRELYAQTLRGYWDVYPSAKFDTVELNLRGSSVSLPILGNYMYDVIYQVVGRYNNSSTTYPGANSASSGYGKSGFFAGSGGYQIDNSAQVDFTW